MTNLLWLDFETTDVDEPLRLLEVGAIASRNLDFGEEYHAYFHTQKVDVVRHSAPAIVREMHDANGLWSDLTDACAKGDAKSVEEVETDLLMLIAEAFGRDATVYLAGAGVGHFDHGLIKSRMPRLAGRLHYSPIDVSITARTLDALAGIRLPKPDESTSNAHRALHDVYTMRERARLLSNLTYSDEG